MCFTGLSFAQSNPCAGLYWGQVVPHPNDCVKYYVCILTVPNLRTCGANTVFYPTENRCVTGNQETCDVYGVTTQGPPIGPSSSSTYVPTTSTEAATTTTTQTTTETTTTRRPPPDLGAICRGVFFAARPYPDSYDTYVGCVRGNGVLFQCFADEVFDPSTNECVHTIQ